MRIIQIAAEERLVAEEGVLSRLKPYGAGFGTGSKNASNKTGKRIARRTRRAPTASPNPNHVLTEAYREFIENCGPYVYFITLTFGRNVSKQQKCQYTNTLLRRYNQRIFHHDFKKRNKFHEGFAFFEEHLSTEFADRSHIHILLKENARYDDFNLCSHIEIFFKTAGEVFDAKDRSVFNPDCIDFRPAGDVFRIDYCQKSIWDKNISQIKMIGKTGLSDNL